MTPTTPAEHARDLIVQRLVDAHGLDETTARDAVDRYRRREEGPHQVLVWRAAREVHAALVRDTITEAIRQFAEAIRPLVEAAQRTVDAIDTARSSRTDRPAWQSPYGPPQHRSAKWGGR